MDEQINAALEASGSLGEVRSIHRKEKFIMVIYGIRLKVALTLLAVMTGFAFSPGYLADIGILRHVDLMIPAMILAATGATMIGIAALSGEHPRVGHYGAIGTTSKHLAFLGTHVLIYAAVCVAGTLYAPLAAIGIALDAALISGAAVWRFRHGQDGLIIRRRDGFCYSYMGRFTLVWWKQMKSAQVRIDKYHSYLVVKRHEAPGFTFRDPYIECYDGFLHTAMMEAAIANGLPNRAGAARSALLHARYADSRIIPVTEAMQRRVDAIVEAAGDLGAVLSIHPTGWFASIQRVFFTGCGLMFLMFGLGLATDVGSAAWPYPLVLIFSAVDAAAAAFGIMLCAMSGQNPRLTRPGLLISNDFGAVVAGHTILMLPFLLAGSLNVGFLLTGFGVDFIACQILGLWHSLTGRDGLAVLFEYGFGYSFDGVIKVFSWDHIGMARLMHNKHGQTLMLTMRNTQFGEFNDQGLDNYRGLFKSIVVAVYETQNARVPALR